MTYRQTNTVICDGCGLELLIGMGSAPDDWTSQEVSFGKGRIWVTQFCPSCVRHDERIGDYLLKLWRRHVDAEGKEKRKNA